MKKRTAFNKVWLYIICAFTLSAGFASCDTDDSDVSRLIAGGGGGPAPEKPFAMEGTWVAGGVKTQATITVLGNDIELGETVEGLLLGLLNKALPLQLEQLSDLEVALKIEPGIEADKAKLSSPTIDLLVGNQELAIELPKTEPFAIKSEGGLAEILKDFTLLNYVTEETPDGIKISESPLAGLGEQMGEEAMLQSIKFACKTSLFETAISEENRTGGITLTLNGKLKIATTNSGLIGIFMKNAETLVKVSLHLQQWTALD